MLYNTNMNYNEVMEQQIKKLNGKPRLLLHACCCPCSISALEKLNGYFDITIYFYNPNIDTEQEYLLRLSQFDKIKTLYDFDLVAQPYTHQEFLDKCKNYAKDKEGGKRCQECITMRIQKAIDYAKANGFDYVTTTLTSSPMKDADYINTIGMALAKMAQINYLPSDFKKKNGYLHSIEICAQYKIYRQHYCGCEFGKNNQVYQPMPQKQQN